MTTAHVSHVPEFGRRAAAACAPTLRPLDVDMESLEIGARDASDETQSYLDTESGEVVVILKGEPDARLLRERVRRERQRFAQVPPFGLAEERALLRQFLAQTTHGSGRALLMRLVDEPGAFHACLAALKADAALWRAWERFEMAGLRGNLVGWMAALGLRPTVVLSAYDDE
ncbi:MAG: UPF0158 family protein [Myxococcota bacterium]